MAKNLQAAKQEAKQLQAAAQNTISALGEMKAAILVEVSALGETMWKLYDSFVTMHEVVVCLHGLQQ